MSPAPKSTRLLERHAELAEIAERLGAAAAGSGGVVLFEGPAGIGKSELLAATRREGTDRGMQVLSARAEELSAGWPLGVAVQLFQRRVADAPPDERARLLSGPAARAARLLTTGEAGPEAGGDLLWLLYALAWLAEELAAPAGLVLTVDDCHLADRASLRFLAYLARRVEDLPIALVVAARRESGVAPELLAELAAAPVAGVVRPGPLSVAAAAEVVRTELGEADAAFCEACWTATRGNPFLLTELVRAARRSRLAPTAGAAGAIAATVPDAVLRSLGARLPRIPGRARDLMRAVAVLGDDAEPRITATLSGLDEAAMAQAAAGLTAADILAGERRLAVVHPLVRAAVLDDLEPAERAVLHRRAAQLLLDDAAPPERTAAHLMACPGHGASWAVKALQAAAAAALEKGAPETAVAYLGRALEEPPPPADRGPILLAQGAAALAAGLPTAPELLVAAADALPSGRPRAEALERLGQSLHLAGRQAESANAFERAWAELDDQDQEFGERLEAQLLATALLDARRAPSARRRLAELLQTPGGGDSPADRALLAAATIAQAFGAGSTEQVNAMCERVMAGSAVLEEEGPESITAWAAIGCHTWAGAYAQTRRGADRLIELSQLRGSLAGFAYGTWCRAASHVFAGRLIEAVPDLETTLRIWREGLAPYLPGGLSLLSWCQIERGDLDAAETTLTSLPDPDRWTGTPMHLVYRVGQARLALARGDHSRALEAAAGCRDEAIRLGAVNPALGPWRSIGALAAAALGDVDFARASVGEELSLARGFGNPQPIGIALRVAARLETGPEGVELLREAVDVLTDSEAELELAHAEHELGARLRRERQRSEARDPLRRALERATRCGAAPLARRAREELVAAGARPRRSALSGVAALTPSELRVAQLAADGRTNREVAEQLFVGRRTVETHLQHAYQKLGISGRPELAGALASIAPAGKDRGARHDAPQGFP